jgi:hypothetical protein
MNGVNGSGANGTRSATATSARPVAKSALVNGAGASSTAKTAKNSTTETQSQRDRVLAARQRNAAARAAADRRRSLEGGWLRRQWPMVAAVVTVVLIIAVFFAIARNASSGSASIGSVAPDTVLSKVTGVSQGVSEKIGTGGVANPFQKTQGNPPVNKTADGKPIFLYIGADYCPFCASERWSVVTALSRFGTFSNIKLMQSSSTDTYPNTSTFTFQDASYTSQYLDFQMVETADRSGNPLEKMSSDQQAIFDKYDAPPYVDQSNTGAIPFLSSGNQYVQIGLGSGFTPQAMQGMTWQDIADKLNDPNSGIAKGIVGNANYITAAICQLTDNKPANVCTAAPIPQIISDMKAGK